MTATIRELKNRLSEYLRRVQEGEHLVVTDHGRPIARVERLRADQLGPEQRLALMAEAGEITQPRKRGRLSWRKPTPRSCATCTAA